MKKIDSLPQRELLHELRAAVDAVRITDPLRGPAPGARDRLRRMIRENPHSVQSLHIRHNLGRQRVEWLDPLIKDELNGAVAK